MWELDKDEMTLEEEVLQKYGSQYQNIRDIKSYITYKDGTLSREIKFTADVVIREIAHENR